MVFRVEKSRPNCDNYDVEKCASGEREKEMSESFRNDCAVILAAGDGKRMHAPVSKVLCEVACKPMLEWVIDAAKAAEDMPVCVVVSADDVAELAEKRGCEVRRQNERKGTGHAVMMAEDFLRGHEDGNVLVLCGDAPFIDRDTILGALEKHVSDGNDMTVVTAVLGDGGRYGRIIRDGSGVLAIREAADCAAGESSSFRPST